MQDYILFCKTQSLVPQVLREIPADEVAHTAIAVSHSGRVVFTGTSSGTIRTIKYPLPIQKDWIMYQAHCGPVTKVGLNIDEHCSHITLTSKCVTWMLGYFGNQKWSVMPTII